MIRPGGGVYLWNNREAAECFYSDSWKNTIAQRYEAQPEILFYETPVIVENADRERRHCRRLKGVSAFFERLNF